MWIDERWQQAGVDALRAMLDVDAALKRRMIEFLFEEGFWDRDKLSWDGAVARFNACLNPAQAQFFKLSEIWALAKRFERYQVIEAMAQDLGFRLSLVPTEARRQTLLERIAVAMEQAHAVMARSAAELERLERPHEDAPRLHPATRERGSHFALGDDDVGGKGGF